MIRYKKDFSVRHCSSTDTPYPATHRQSAVCEHRQSDTDTPYSANTGNQDIEYARQTETEKATHRLTQKREVSRERRAKTNTHLDTNCGCRGTAGKRQREREKHTV